MMRYIKRLDRKDVSLAHSMIPLGSCTMKLNPATAMFAITWPEFANLHPFVPLDQAQGYHEMMSDLRSDLAKITGFADVSLQPNSGANGEYSGLMVIRAWHEHRGEGHRNVALIPASAHGTNPASAVMAGLKVVVVDCDDKGNIDMEDLRSKVEEYSDILACVIVTYPSTHGVFEASIRELCDISINMDRVYMTVLYDAQVDFVLFYRACMPPQPAQDICNTSRWRRSGSALSVLHPTRLISPGHPVDNRRPPH